MKILAVASKGGHWIQLLRIVPAFEGHEVVYVSTDQGLADTVKGFEFHNVNDGSRKNVFRLFSTLSKMVGLITKLKPDLIITTGAAPGLMGVIAGKFLGVKTIWIDSIANVEKTSTSGRIATLFVDRAYTQWPELANKKFMFDGNILS